MDGGRQTGDTNHHFRFRFQSVAGRHGTGSGPATVEVHVSRWARRAATNDSSCRRRTGALAAGTGALWCSVHVGGHGWTVLAALGTTRPLWQPGRMLVASRNVLRPGAERDSPTAVLAVPTTIDDCRPTPSRSQQRRRRRFQFFTSTSRKQTASSAAQRPAAVVPLEESALSSDVGVFLFVLMRVCLIVWLHSSADRRAQASRLCCSQAVPVRRFVSLPFLSVRRMGVATNVWRQQAWIRVCCYDYLMTCAPAVLCFWCVRVSACLCVSAQKMEKKTREYLQVVKCLLYLTLTFDLESHFVYFEQKIACNSRTEARCSDFAAVLHDNESWFCDSPSLWRRVDKGWQLPWDTLPIGSCLRRRSMTQTQHWLQLESCDVLVAESPRSLRKRVDLIAEQDAWFNAKMEIRRANRSK